MLKAELLNFRVGLAIVALGKEMPHSAQAIHIIVAVWIVWKKYFLNFLKIYLFFWPNSFTYLVFQNFYF